MIRSRYLILLGVMILIFNMGCVYSLARIDGPYEGRIIDADTGKPIEGVVVFGVWYRIAAVGAGGAFHAYHDAQETVTDRNGEFVIKGLGLKILSGVEPMSVLIFKAGYEYIDVSWDLFKENDFYKKKIKWEGNKAIIPLRKLTMEERKKSLGPPYPPTEAVKEKKVKLLIEEINKDRREQGLKVTD